MFRSPLLAVAVFAIGPPQAHGQSQLTTAEYEQFSKLANCSLKNELATASWYALVHRLSSIPEANEELDLDAWGKLVIKLDDDRAVVAEKLSRFATEHSWTEEQVIFREDIATARYQGLVDRRMKKVAQSKDFGDLVTLASDLLMDAVSCNSELLIDELTE
jgi:hypothetical protein